VKLACAYDAGIGRPERLARSVQQAEPPADATFVLGSPKTLFCVYSAFLTVFPKLQLACPAGTPWARNGSSPWYGPFWAQASTFLSCWFACSSDSPVQTLQRRRPLHPRDARLLNLERLALALLLVLLLLLPPPLPPPFKSPRSFSLSSSHHRAKPHSLLLRHARTQFGVPRPASLPCPGTADRHRRIPA
jgi:hypothetical protein